MPFDPSIFVPLLDAIFRGGLGGAAAEPYIIITRAILGFFGVPVA